MCGLTNPQLNCKSPIVFCIAETTSKIYERQLPQQHLILSNRNWPRSHFVVPS